MNEEAKTDLTRALAFLADDEYRTGEGWKRAHQIAQAHEGDSLFDRLHALCHRIEGDDGNAGYWYQRAGIDVSGITFADEASAIRQAAKLN